MNKIEITYKRNATNKFDFTAKQNGNVIFAKAYSPKEDENQHIMGIVLVETMQKWADYELSENPDFKWKNFEEFKSWAGSPKIRKEASNKYEEMIFGDE